jgi:dipeptidase E
MSSNRILAFSSSKVGTGGYLETAVPVIKDFLGDAPLTIAFIPFASVATDHETYTNMVKVGLKDLPYIIETVTPANAKELINKAGVIMVGGGNTFKLLHDMYAFKLLDIIRDKVNTGTPYIGWSAGSNILGPGIGTTNDMPVIEPPSFNTLGLFPFQINPHYNNEKPAGHNGETRDQRLQEFVLLNPGLPIVGLPEGTALKLENDNLQFIGGMPGVLFTGGEHETSMSKKEIAVNTDLGFLL